MAYKMALLQVVVYDPPDSLVEVEKSMLVGEDGGPSVTASGSGVGGTSTTGLLVTGFGVATGFVVAATGTGVGAVTGAGAQPENVTVMVGLISCRAGTV